MSTIISFTFFKSEKLSLGTLVHHILTANHRQFREQKQLYGMTEYVQETKLTGRLSSSTNHLTFFVSTVLACWKS